MHKAYVILKYILNFLFILFWDGNKLHFHDTHTRTHTHTSERSKAINRFKYRVCDVTMGGVTLIKLLI